MSEFNQVSGDNPFLNNVFSDETSYNEDLENGTLSELRKISSNLVKNNFIASTIINTLINTCIGGNIKVNVFKNKKIQPKVTELLNKRLDDINENNEDLHEFLTRLMSSMLEHGDVLYNIIEKENGSFGVELVEAYRVDTPREQTQNKNVIDGVEYRKGKEIAYYVKDVETGRIYTKLKRINSFGGREIKIAGLIKCPVNRRVGQTRQTPYLLPSMNLIRYVVDYLNTTIIQARVAATFSGFIKSDIKGPIEERLKDGTGLIPVGKLQAGMIWQMRRGEEISFASPTRPSDNTDSFIRRITSLIAATNRIPHEVLFLDLNNTSYLAFRGGYIEFRRLIYRFYMTLKGVISNVAYIFLLEEFVKGELKDDPESLKIEVKLPPLSVLDEEKTARANKISIGERLTSRTDIADSLGDDWEETFHELEVEEEMLAELAGNMEALKQKAYEEACAEYGIIPLTEKSVDGRPSVDGRSIDGIDSGDPLKEKKNRPKDKNKDSDQKKEERKEDGNW